MRPLTFSGLIVLLLREHLLGQHPHSFCHQGHGYRPRHENWIVE
jgi:hypothetical protein